MSRAAGVAATLLLSAALLAGCLSEESAGLAVSQAGQGPAVVHDPLLLPDPEIPYPNDLATRYDATSATGRRLNLAQGRPLEVERRLRRTLDRLDGFSTIGPISVAFDGPLDLSTVGPDTVQVYDVTPGSPELGRSIPLDFGGGAFPVTFSPRPIFAFEEHAELPDLLFGPDNDFDGKRISHYEVETNTLIFRPLLPLRERTTYAVVLTRGLLGADGEPIRSSLPFVNHASQTHALLPVADMVQGGASEIGFAWSFTTRSVAADLVAIRRGMDGEGPLSWLKDAHPPSFVSFLDTDVPNDGDGTVEGLPVDPRDHIYTLKPGMLPKLLGVLGLVTGGIDSLKYESVDYFVLGSLRTVDLRGPDGVIWVREGSGEVDHQESEATFLLSVPRATAEHQPPFPVILYNHGARTSRMELILIAESMARAGLAMIGIDAVGHGPFGGDLGKIIEREAPAELTPAVLSALIGGVAQAFLGADYEFDGKDINEILDDLAVHNLFRALFVDGRSTDVDGDGVLLSGDSYFVPSVFELVAAGQQTIADNFMVYRLLSRLEPGAVPAAISEPGKATLEELRPSFMAGDFNADGVLDIGGPDNRYYAMGTSLGGIHTSVLMAVEPGLVTGAPIVSGGGMTDMLVRTNLEGAVDAILAEAMGPAVVACPIEGGEEAALSWNNWALKCRDANTIGSAEEASGLPRVPIVPNGTAELTNLRLLAEALPAFADEDAVHTAAITEAGGFGATVAADIGDPLVLVLRDSDGEEVYRDEFAALREGLGRARNSPRLRRLIQVAQTAMDGSDPLAYARFLLREPIDGVPRNVLHVTDIGDRTVPFSTMVAWDRAVGLHGLDDPGALLITTAFLEHDALAGQKPYWDIDDLSQSGVGLGPLPLIQTTSGVSGVRHAATGHHEFIAVRDPDAPFDNATYFRNQILHFLATDGQEIRDDLCLEDGSCDFLP